MGVLEENLRKDMLEVFHEDTVTEWMEVYLQPARNDLTKILLQGKEMRAHGARPKTYGVKDMPE